MLLLAVARPAHSQEGGALTERDAVTRALARAPVADMLDARVSAEEGRARTLGAAPNPEVSYAREQTFGSAGTGEDYVTLSQGIDIGGRRGLRARAGRTRAVAARLDGDAARLTIVADVRSRFYEALHRQNRVAVLERWTNQVADALDIVSKRERRGDVAFYDRRRLEREQSVAAGRLASERGLLNRAWARLLALVGDSPQIAIAGQLLPEADPPPLEALRAVGAKRPDFLALDQRERAAREDRAAAGRWWLPDLRLEAGWKGVDLGSQRADGFVLGAALAVPLWDRSTGLAQTAEAEAREARGRRTLLASELDRELGGIRTASVELRAAAVTYRQQTSAQSAELVRMATAGYAAGELSLLELLDAYRGAADDELTALDMEHAARAARLELDEMTGAGLP